MQNCFQSMAGSRGLCRDRGFGAWICRRLVTTALEQDNPGLRERWGGPSSGAHEQGAARAGWNAMASPAFSLAYVNAFNELVLKVGKAYEASYWTAASDCCPCGRRSREGFPAAMPKSKRDKLGECRCGGFILLRCMPGCAGVGPWLIEAPPPHARSVLDKGQEEGQGMEGRHHREDSRLPGRVRWRRGMDLQCMRLSWQAWHALHSSQAGPVSGWVGVPRPAAGPGLMPAWGPDAPSPLPPPPRLALPRLVPWQV